MRGVVLSLILVTPGLGGCADPCHDDGLNQGGCPEADVGGTDSETATASDTETLTASMSLTDSMSESQTETDPTAMTASGDGNMCPTLEETLVPTTPTMQLVIDQSGSMDDDFGGQTRWEAVRDTLIDPDSGIVTRRQSTIRFGASLYSNPGECPQVIEQAPQLDAQDEIATLLGMNMPDGETPTGESLDVVVQTLLADEWDGPKFIVLATDGEPDTCAVPDPQSNQEIDMVRAVALTAVEDAFSEGIETFVISVGEDIAADHLQDLANAGAGNDPGDPDADFFVALDADALTDAFDAIISGVRDCELALPMPLDAELADTCDLTINGTSVPFEDPDGWDLLDESTVELVGAACDSIQSGFVAIRMMCSCEA